MPLDLSRRQALIGTAALALAARAGAQDLPSPAGTPREIAADAGYWDAVRRHYTVTDEIVNLENGYWGLMADPVLSRFVELTQMVNTRNSYFARREFGDELGAAVERLAGALGVEPTEVALTRGASEALQNLIGGYNRIEPGDAVLHADLDYDAMIYNMQWLAERRGAKVVAITIPEPATREAVLETYRAAFDAEPRLKLVLLTHVSHRTGLMPPVREIAAMARERGADVILDAAHSWGQVDFSPRDLGIPFVGFNLHKWIGNPQGAGAIYVAADRVADIDPYMGEGGYLGDAGAPPDTVRARVHTGTVNMATWLTLPAALDFHEAVGPGAKEARLRRLRDLWVAEVRDVPGVDVLTPDDPSMHAGITSFRLNGETTREGNVAIVERLAEEFGIFTTRRGGVAAGDCVRVTPAVYNTEDDVMRLAQALRSMARG